MKAFQFAAGVSLVSLGLFLSACGGGEVNSTPTPTPTPVPTPAPTPTPTPTPATAYKTIAEVLAQSGDKTFLTAGVKWQSAPQPAGQAAVPFGAQLTLSYIASTNSYRIARPGGGQVDFEASTGTGPSGVRRFDTTSGAVSDTLFLLIPRESGVELSYTRFATYGHHDTGTDDNVTYLSVWGVPTVTADMPKTGSASYHLIASGSAKRANTVVLVDELSATFSANFETGTVATQFGLSGTAVGETAPTFFGNFSGTGLIASGGPGFSGGLTGGNGSGQFGGAFFGPKAAEFGYSWYLLGTDFEARGYAAGTKNGPSPP